jgi:hypothetical protein
VSGFYFVIRRGAFLAVTDLPHRTLRLSFLSVADSLALQADRKAEKGKWTAEKAWASSYIFPLRFRQNIFI